MLTELVETLAHISYATEMKMDISPHINEEVFLRTKICATNVLKLGEESEEKVLDTTGKINLPHENSENCMMSYPLRLEPQRLRTRFSSVRRTISEAGTHPRL